MKKFIAFIITALVLTANIFAVGVENTLFYGSSSSVEESFGYSFFNTDYVNSSIGFAYGKKTVSESQYILGFDISSLLFAYLLDLKEDVNVTNYFTGVYFNTDFNIPFVKSENFTLALNPGIQVEAGYDSVAHSALGNFGLGINPSVNLKAIIAKKTELFMGYKACFDIPEIIDSDFKYVSGLNLGARFVFKKSKSVSKDHSSSYSSINVQSPRFVQTY